MHIVLTAGEVQSGDGGLRATFIWGSFGQLVEVLFVISGFVVYLPTIAPGWRFRQCPRMRDKTGGATSSRMLAGLGPLGSAGKDWRRSHSRLRFRVLKASEST